MRAFALLLALPSLLLSTAATADSQVNERVFNDAKVQCPSAMRSTVPVSEFLGKFFSEAGYSSEEKLLMLNYCLMYAYGMRDARG